MSLKVIISQSFNIGWSKLDPSKREYSPVACGVSSSITSNNWSLLNFDKIAFSTGLG